MRAHDNRGYAPEPSRARHLLVLTAATLAVVALLGAVVAAIGELTSSPDDDTASDVTSAETSDRGSGRRAAANPGEWESDPDTGLPIGTTSQEGRPVGFPHTEAGAAAMVVELNRAQIGLDYDHARTTIRIYAAPEDQVFFDALAIDAIDQRREDLGVPTISAPTGGGSAGGELAQVVAPAGYAQTPIGYQVQEYGAGRYLVSVLNVVTATTSNGRVTRTAYVGQQLVAWTDDTGDRDMAGDWKLVEPSDADRTRILATPPPALTSMQFEHAGWSALLSSSTYDTSSDTSDGTSSDTSSGADDEGSQ